MGSDEEHELSPKLPFIDFSSEQLKPGTPIWDSLKPQIREALQEYGCFEASLGDDSTVNPGKLQRDVFSSLKELFDLPLHTKQQSGVSQPFQHGYAAPNPFYQSFGMDDPNSLDAVETFTKTLWTRGGNPSFSNNIHSMAGVVSEFDRTVRRMILESFGLEKYIDEHLSSTTYHFRVMKYEAVQPHGETELGLRVHTDKSFMTILCQNEVGGLELQTKRGEWVKFRPTSPSSFVVLIGDALHVWLNGRVHCPKHKVTLRHLHDKSRYSFGLFTIPKPGYVIKAPEELIDEEHPLRFKPFAYQEYFGLAYSKSGVKDASILHVPMFPPPIVTSKL
ncbi:unnamed protein product [Linum tenue]|uniref:Fe2OG dioxygenase domain-containing protein n=1 Tax=Linum tenue TaxID=586396 RepID=A0AAV0NGU4_9ROSI|nr:unnamed protein product [Linum tenue]